MNWGTFFYCCLRWMVATPIALLLSVTLLALMVFELVFGTPDDVDAIDTGHILDGYRILFTDTLTR